MSGTADDDVPEEWRDLVDSVVRVLAVADGIGYEVKIGISRITAGTVKWLPAGGWCLTIPNLIDLCDEDTLEELGGIYNVEAWNLYISHQQAASLVAAMRHWSVR
jgi:hypothetical protein